MSILTKPRGEFTRVDYNLIARAIMLTLIKGYSSDMTNRRRILEEITTALTTWTKRIKEGDTKPGDRLQLRSEGQDSRKVLPKV